MSSKASSISHPQRVIFRPDVAPPVAKLKEDVLIKKTIIPEAKISKKAPTGTDADEFLGVSVKPKKEASQAKRGGMKVEPNSTPSKTPVTSSQKTKASASDTTDPDLDHSFHIPPLVSPDIPPALGNIYPAWNPNVPPAYASLLPPGTSTATTADAAIATSAIFSTTGVVIPSKYPAADSVLPPSAFLPVAQTPWEQDVVWDDTAITPPTLPSALEPHQIDRFTATAVALTVQAPVPPTDQQGTAAPLPEPSGVTGIARQGVFLRLPKNIGKNHQGKQEFPHSSGLGNAVPENGSIPSAVEQLLSSDNDTADTLSNVSMSPSSHSTASVDASVVRTQALLRARARELAGGASGHGNGHGSGSSSGKDNAASTATTTTTTISTTATSTSTSTTASTATSTSTVPAVSAVDCEGDTETLPHLPRATLPTETPSTLSHAHMHFLTAAPASAHARPSNNSSIPSPWTIHAPTLLFRFAPPRTLPRWVLPTEEQQALSTESGLAYSGTGASTIKATAQTTVTGDVLPVGALPPLIKAAIAREAAVLHNINAVTQVPFTSFALTSKRGGVSLAGLPAAPTPSIAYPWEKTVDIVSENSETSFSGNVFSQLPAFLQHLYMDATQASTPSLSTLLTAPPSFLPSPSPSLGLDLSLDSLYLHHKARESARAAHAEPARNLYPPWITARMSLFDALSWHKPYLPTHTYVPSPADCASFAAGASRAVAMLSPPASVMPPMVQGSQAKVLHALTTRGVAHTLHPSPDPSPVDMLTKLVEAAATDNRPAPKFVKRMTELSVSDGCVVLLEYTDQSPMVLNAVGMATEIVTYYRRRANEAELSEASILGGAPPDFLGRLRVLSHHEATQLSLYQVSAGCYATFVENALFVAPLSRTWHPLGYKDYLLCNTQLHKQAIPQWIIRPMPRVYTVGRVIPRVPIPAPRTKAWDVLRAKWANAIIQRYFSNENTCMLASTFCGYFGDRQTAKEAEYTNDADIIDNFSGEACACPVRDAALDSISVIARWRKQSSSTPIGGRDLVAHFDDSGQFESQQRLPPQTNDQLCSLCTPEDACVVQAVTAAALRLRYQGVLRFLNLEEKGLGRILYRGASLQQAREDLQKHIKADPPLVPATALGTLRKKLTQLDPKVVPGLVRVGAWILRQIRRTPWAVSSAIATLLKNGKLGLESQPSGFLGIREFLPIVAGVEKSRDEKSGRDRRPLLTSTSAVSKAKPQSLRKERARDTTSYSSAASGRDGNETTHVLQAAGYSVAELQAMSRSERQRRAALLGTVQKVGAQQQSGEAAKQAVVVTKRGSELEGIWAQETDAHISALSSFDPLPAPVSTTYYHEVPLPQTSPTGDSSAPVSTPIVEVYNGVSGLRATQEEESRLTGHDIRALAAVRGASEHHERMRPYVIDAVEPKQQIRPFFSPTGSADPYTTRSGMPVPRYYRPVTEQVLKRTITRVHPNGMKEVLVEYILDPDAITRFQRDPEEFPPASERGVASVKVDGVLVPVQRHGTAVRARGKRGKGSVGRKRKNDDAEEFIPSSSVYPTARMGGAGTGRRIRDAAVALGSELDRCIDCIFQLPENVTGWFRQPVDKKAYPHYYQVIPHPMDLFTLRQKTKTNAYKSAGAFEADLALIYTNSSSFNGLDHTATHCALQVVQCGRQFLQAHKEELESLEKEISAQGQQSTVNSRLLAIVEELVHMPLGEFFLHKPTDKVAPGYEKIVKNPMWLNLIKERCSTNAYGSVSQFLQDLALMRDNCLAFNADPTHFLRPAAENIYTRGCELADALPDDIRAWQGTGTIDEPKTKQRRTAKSAAKAGGIKKQRAQAANETAASVARAVEANKNAGGDSVSHDDVWEDDDFGDIF